MTRQEAKAYIDSIGGAETKPASMTGDSFQKLCWHIMCLEDDLEGARALRDTLPLLPEAAQRYLMDLLQRGMR
jgi:hypothetical protein